MYTRRALSSASAGESRTARRKNVMERIAAARQQRDDRLVPVSRMAREHIPQVANDTTHTASASEDLAHTELRNELREIIANDALHGANNADAPSEVDVALDVDVKKRSPWMIYAAAAITAVAALAFLYTPETGITILSANFANF